MFLDYVSLASELFFPTTVSCCNPPGHMTDRIVPWDLHDSRKTGWWALGWVSWVLKMTALLLRGFPPSGQSSVSRRHTWGCRAWPWMCGDIRKASWFSLLSVLVGQTLSPFTLEDIWQSVAEPLPSARVGVACLGEAEANTVYSHTATNSELVFWLQTTFCMDQGMVTCVLTHSSSATALEIA